MTAINETIVNITEGSFYLDGEIYQGSPIKKYYIGWQIHTDKQIISIGIEDGTSCCENYGYIELLDKVKDFIGATLLAIHTTDTNLNCIDFDKLYISVDDCMFVNIETSKGTFQLTVYNSHNGYYGHKTIINSLQVKEEDYL